MKEFLGTTPGRIVLGIIVLAVWGVNVANFSEMNVGDEVRAIQQVQAINLEELVIPETVNYEYQTADRNPFLNSQKSVNIPQLVTNRDREEERIELPRLQLTGVFDGMAVISDERGQTYFVKNGETFRNEIEVELIASDSVILEYKKRTFTLKMN